MNETVVLFSGGPDSTLALHRCLKEGYRVHALTLLTERESKDGEAALCLVRDLPVTKHVLVDAFWATQLFSDIPGMALCVGGDASNGCGVKTGNPAPLSIELMHMMACMYALAHNIHTVAWAIQADEVPDPTALQNYLKKLSEIVYLRTDEQVDFVLPIINLSKARVLQELVSLGVSIDQTYSCNDKITGPCGICDHCRMRQAAELAAFGSPTVPKELLVAS